MADEGAGEGASEGAGEGAGEVPQGAVINWYDRNSTSSKINLEHCKTRLALEGFSLPRMLVEASWLDALPGEFQRPYARCLAQYVEEDDVLYPVCPPKFQIFNAFNHTHFDSVKVVLLGQKQPYTKEGRAMGLSYSVPPRVKKFSLELENILRELADDIGGPIPSRGSLVKWALQGVLLLSMALTVRLKRPNTHLDIGWEQFVDTVIEQISLQKTNVVFLLWGTAAQTKSSLIDHTRHHVLMAPSPSPMSVANSGFFGRKHFSQCNNYLQEHGIQPIDWKLS